MDLQMPELGGIDTLGSIRGEFLEARSTVLTTYAGDFFGRRRFTMGNRNRGRQNPR